MPELRFKFQVDHIDYTIFKKELDIYLTRPGVLEIRKNDDNTVLPNGEFKNKNGDVKDPARITGIHLQGKAGQLFKMALAMALKIKSAPDTRHAWFDGKITTDDETWITIHGVNTYEVRGNDTLMLEEGDFTDFATEKIIRICNYPSADKAICDGHEGGGKLEEAVGKIVEILDEVYKVSKKYHGEKQLANIPIDTGVTKLAEYWEKSQVNDSLEEALIELNTRTGGVIKDKSGARIGYALGSTVRSYLIYLSELKVWRDIVKLSSIEDVLRANANGFIIASRDEDNLDTGVTIGKGVKNDGTGTLDNSNGDVGKLNPDPASGAKDNYAAVKAFFDKGATYRGFPIADPEQKVDKFEDDAGWQDAGGEGNLPTEAYLGISGKYGSSSSGFYIAVPSKHYRKEKIDQFREVWSDNSIVDFKKTRGFGPGDLADGNFIGYDTSVNPNVIDRVAISGGHNIFDDGVEYEYEKEYDENTGDPKGTKEKVGTNGSLTKICFDIVDVGISTYDATNLDEVIRIAFLENDFDEVETYDADKKGIEAHTTAIDAEGLLDLYHNLIKCPAASASLFMGGTNYDAAMKSKILLEKGSTGTTSDDGQRKTQIERVEACYQGVKKFIVLMFKNYSHSDAKSDLEAAKTELEKLRTQKGSNADAETLWDYWEERLDSSSNKVAKITAKLNEIDAAINYDPGQTSKLSDANKAELDKLISTDEKNAKAKKVYEAFKALKDTDANKTDGVYGALKNLIKELKKDNLDSSAELEKYGGSSATGDNKTAWNFVNGVDGAKEGGKGWATWKLEQVNNALAAAKTAAKTAMEGESGAAEAIEVDQQTSISLLNDIKEVFEKCKQAHQKQGDAVNLKDKLTEFKSGKSSAWNLVNKYTKSGETEGYAESALKKADQKNDEDKKSFNDYLKLATPQAIREAWEKKKDIDEEDMKRTQAVKYLESKGETELKDLLKKDSLDVYGETDEDLAKIEVDIKLLEAYKNASDTDEKGRLLKELGEIDSKFGDSKAFLEKWIKRLEVRRDALKQKQEERNKNNEEKDEKPPFYKTTLGILLIGFAVIVVIGGILWLFLKSRGEEEIEE